MKKYTIKVFPEGWGRIAYRVMEVPGDITLDQLCEEILKAFDFDEDHMYEFCMDNRLNSAYTYQSELDGGLRSTNIKLDKLGVSTRQKFSLHYDFGDDWMFAINVQSIEETEEKVEPRIIKGKGTVEQYPDPE